MLVDDAVARIAATIGEPARARILFSLMDNHARTATELAVIATVTPSTASVHLNRLKQENLVHMIVQGKHRYFRLAGADVAHVLEGLSVLAGESNVRFKPNKPDRLRAARTCYDHLAGTLGVALHDRLCELAWIAETPSGIEVTASGQQGLSKMGIDLEEARSAKPRRRFGYACLDWTERRFHIGGVLGAALLQNALRRKWVEQDLDSRALDLTAIGRRAFRTHFGLHDVRL